MRKIWLAACGVLAAAVIFLFFWLPGRYVVPVLMYHSISIAENQRDSANSVSPAAFERQMRFIKQNGYRVLTADEYAAITAAGGKFPAKSVVITFDDGVLDNFTQAYPVLRKYDLPALIFVPSAAVGGPAEQWAWPRLDRAQMLEMSAHGITIGSHTVTHAYLPDLPLDTARREIVDSKRELERQLGRNVDYLAFPTGGFSDEMKLIARQAGYKAAFTTNRGRDRLNWDLYEIKRIRIKDADGAVVLLVKLSGYYNLIRDSQSPY
ncbi:MAG: polysaccharide deacetylase family protein [Candidatus Omnitrophica bacterium]|nr:polysaccharide deacetylase family protein [Candidatus Omnitrophota bacterium]